MKRVEEVYDVQPGQKYLVTCFVHEGETRIDIDWNDQSTWMDLEDLRLKPQQYRKFFRYIPVIDHPHNDKENGQPDTHYHLDDRFAGPQEHLPEGHELDFYSRFYPEQNKHYRKVVLALRAQNPLVATRTATSLISNSKFKHKCIHKGKCPHRGYDLTNVGISPDGTVTCPLHSLKFNPDTLELLDLPNQYVK